MDPLATPDELAAYLRVATVEEATAELLLAGASQTVRDECRWAITLQEEVTLTADANGSRLLLLPTLNLLAVTAVRVDGEAIDASQYTWSTTGQLYRAGGWPAKFSSVEVDCDHGYNPAPDSVKLVTLELAARGYTNPERVSQRSVGSVSNSFDLEPLDLARLDPYRLP